MSDAAVPVILVLDPDLDFLEAMEKAGGTREVKLIAQPYAAKDRYRLEEIIQEHYPDIVVINLDQDDELDYASPVIEILKIPIPMPPIILGTTSRDAVALKSRAYENGIDDYVIRPFVPREAWMRLDVLLRIRRLQRQLNEATRKLSSLNLALNNSNRHLEEMTLTDELTGLNNMRFMMSYLEKQFSLFARYDRPFSVMMIDLDHFKSVNDQNDHLVGSETIKQIGAIIQAATRASDIKARYGGDEYIIAMPETECQAAQRVGERIREAIAAFELKGNDEKVFKITASIGAATFERGRHGDFKDLIRDADYALYLAKKGGRNQVHLFDSSGDQQKVDDYDASQSGVMSELKKMKAS